jgi:large subunit ribosomal protein L1
MAKGGKRARANSEHAAAGERLRTLSDAVRAVKERANAKFDETVDIAVQLGIDPRKSDQMVRGVVRLPEGSGRKVRVAVAAEPELQDAAKSAGADKVGLEDLIESIKKGELDFDVLIASPAAMRSLSQVAKILGPKGLMPNPKSGTVTREVGETVEQFRKGQIQFRSDKAGIVHLPVGKASFTAEALLSNVNGVIEALRKGKPSSSKGIYLLRASLSSTMGAGVPFDISAHR